MLNFCYTQIPYQFFDIGINYFNKGNFDQALYNFEKSESIANPELILEIDSYKREIALAIIADVENNLDNNSFSNSIYKLNKTENFSFFWAETDRVESKILIKKGDILKKLIIIYMLLIIISKLLNLILNYLRILMKNIMN